MGEACDVHPDSACEYTFRYTTPVRDDEGNRMDLFPYYKDEPGGYSRTVTASVSPCPSTKATLAAAWGQAGDLCRWTRRALFGLLAVQIVVGRALVFVKARFAQRRCMDLSNLEDTATTTEGSDDWEILNLPSDSDSDSRDSFATASDDESEPSEPSRSERQG